MGVDVELDLLGIQPAQSRKAVDINTMLPTRPWKATIGSKHE